MGEERVCCGLHIGECGIMGERKDREGKEKGWGGIQRERRSVKDIQTLTMVEEVEFDEEIGIG